MNFKVSGSFYHMNEPENVVISMPHGMDSYILLRFYEPMIITSENNTIVTESNACIIFSPNTSRCYRSIRGDFTNDYISFLADEAFIQKYSLPINQVFYVAEPQQLSSYIGFITWALTDVLHDHENLIREQVDSALMYIQCNILPIPSEKSREYQMHEPYVELRSKMLAEPTVWTVEKLADKMHLSRSHFSVNYKKIFGVSPSEELSAAIVNKARRLLTEADEKVSVIAEECGYINTENFIRAFKRAVGTTPLAYRKKMK